MSNIQTGAERMPHDLSHLGFLAGQIGRLITISTTPVIAGDSFEMDAVGALRLSPLRRGLAIDSTVDIFTFYVPHRHVYGEQWIKFMKDGVNATPLPTVNTTGYIDHAAFLGTINPDTNKIPKHLFQGYLNIYINYFKAPWMPDRTEANPNELNQDDARYGFRCCLLFFSSRRRHTRFDCDWSSDVCFPICLARRVGDVVAERYQRVHAAEGEAAEEELREHVDSGDPSRIPQTLLSQGLLHRHGDDLALLPRDEHVVLLVQRVVLVGRERMLVGLDEAAVFAEVLERVADLDAVGRPGLLDRQAHQVHGVVGVGGTDRRQDVLGALDAVLGLQRRDHAIAHVALLAEERIGLHEDDRFRELTGQIGEAPATDPPVRDGGHVPADLGPALHHLRALGGIGHQDDGVGAAVPEAQELGTHVGVAPIELLEPDGLGAELAEPLGEAFLVAGAPRRGLEDDARLLLAELVGHVLGEEMVDDVVVGGDAEHEAWG